MIFRDNNCLASHLNLWRMRVPNSVKKVSKHKLLLGVMETDAYWDNKNTNQTQVKTSFLTKEVAKRHFFSFLPT